MRSIAILLFSTYPFLLIAGTAAEAGAFLSEMKYLRDCAIRASNATGQALPTEFIKAPFAFAESIKSLSMGQQQAIASLVVDALAVGHCSDSGYCISDDCILRYNRILLKIAEYTSASGFASIINLIVSGPEPPPAEPELDRTIPQPRPAVPEVYPNDLLLSNGENSVRYVLNGYRLCRTASLETGGMYAAEAVKTALCNINKSDDIKQEVVRVADGMNKIACDQPQNCVGIMCDSGYTDIVSTMGNWTKPCG